MAFLVIVLFEKIDEKTEESNNKNLYYPIPIT
jgi:hypothetical protein